MGLWSSTVYVRVRKNRFDLRHLESGAEASVVAEQPFTTARLLVGQFGAAELALRSAFKQLFAGRLFAVSPQVLIQPLEMAEGGLSEIEERVFREVAMGAGARKVAVWVGHELGDDEVRRKLA